MNPRKKMICKAATWNGRKAYTLGNNVVRLTTLTGGGHIAEFQLTNSDGSHSVSPLWVPPWKSIEPHEYNEKRHKREYGTITEGKLLSGIVGHNICLDYFGSPSVEEAKLGMSQHGEAPWSKWTRSRVTQTQQKLALEMSVRLPVAGLRFSREIELRKDEPVVYFTETVRNERKSDHFFHWTQHVTLGPQFLSSEDSLVALPGARAITYPHGYDEGRALLTSNEEFEWPNAPLLKGGKIDLTRPFLRKGLGFVVATLIDKKRNLGFVAAVNHKLGLLIAYCFKRSEFPWIAIWEENLGIAAAPWKQRTQARGLEFSTTPLPVLRREAFFSGRLFDEPTLTAIPALGKKTVRYAALLTNVPNDFGEVRDIQVTGDRIEILGNRNKIVTVQSSGLKTLSE
jgi:hypothetical protein